MTATQSEAPAAHGQGHARATLLGIGLMLTGVFLFSLNDVVGKWLVATYSVGQVLLIRSCAALVILRAHHLENGVDRRLLPCRGPVCSFCAFCSAQPK